MLRLAGRHRGLLRTSAVLFLLVPAAALAQAPVVSFDWTMPDRFGNETLPEGRIAYHYDPAYITPSGWPVSLNGCGTTAAPGDQLMSFSWDIQGTTHNSATGCHFTYTFAALGTYRVKLTVGTRRGQRNSVTKDVVVKDLLIVSMGDSYASGEGNPDVPQVMQKIPGLPVGTLYDAPKAGPVWTDIWCHRSKYAGHAQAALELERAAPRSSVTFVSVACSGASVREGLLAQQTVAVPADAVPALGNPFAYISAPDATARVIYLGVGFQVQELSLQRGDATWQQVDLTHVAGAPPAGSNAVGYVSPDGTARVVYKGTDFHIHELYLQPGAHWIHADLTMLAGAPPAAGVPFGFAEADNTAHVVSRGTDFHIHELYLLPGAHWADADLTLLAGAPPAAGDPIAYVTTDRIPRVLYRGVLGGVHELRREGHWIDADLTNIAGAPPAAGNPFGYVTADKIARVLYRGVAGGVHELRLEGTWIHADLTDIARAPPAAGDPFAYVTPDRIARVLYRGPLGGVHELRLEGTWIDADLTNIAQAPPAGGDPFGYVTVDKIARVLYRGLLGGVHELRLEPGARWQHADLTDIAGIVHKVDPQISAIVQALCPPGRLGKSRPIWHCQDPTRAIDALLIAVGLNDVGFGHIVETLVTNNDPPGNPPIDQIESMQSDLNHRMDTLPTHFQELARGIKDNLNVRAVYVIEYPDPTHDENGRFCDHTPVGDLFGKTILPNTHLHFQPSTGLFNAWLPSGISAQESQWASENVARRLNSLLKQIADSNGWTFVGGISEAFATHGWCAGSFDQFFHDAVTFDPYRPVQRFVRTYEDSRYTQGPFEVLKYGDSRGAMHPNAQGHEIVKNHIIAAIRQHGL